MVVRKESLVRGYLMRRLNSSSFQHERRNGHPSHSPIFPHSARYCLPDLPVTPPRSISSIHGGVFDLQPCLLSQLMQYPFFGLMVYPLVAHGVYSSACPMSSPGRRGGMALIYRQEKIRKYHSRKSILSMEKSSSRNSCPLKPRRKP